MIQASTLKIILPDEVIFNALEVARKSSGRRTPPGELYQQANWPLEHFSFRRLHKGKKRKLYSGLSSVVKQKIDLPVEHLREIFRAVLLALIRLVQHAVRTYV